MTTVAVVGAGVTGLSAAWELQRAGVEVVVLESERRAGGAIVTERRDGFVAGLGVAAARRLDDVIYYPSVTVSLAYEENRIAGKLDGTGFISAGESGAPVRACTYASLKYPGRAPRGFALLRAFVAPVDGDPAPLAHRELAKIRGITGAPLWNPAFHWT